MFSGLVGARQCLQRLARSLDWSLERSFLLQPVDVCLLSGLHFQILGVRFGVEIWSLEIWFRV